MLLLLIIKNVEIMTITVHSWYGVRTKIHRLELIWIVMEHGLLVHQI